MKLTKTQLKQIIKEALEFSIDEDWEPLHGPQRPSPDEPEPSPEQWYIAGPSGVKNLWGGTLIKQGGSFEASEVSSERMAVPGHSASGFAEQAQSRGGIFQVGVGRGKTSGERYYVFGDEIEQSAWEDTAGGPAPATQRPRVPSDPGPVPDIGVPSRRLGTAGLPEKPPLSPSGPPPLPPPLRGEYRSEAEYRRDFANWKKGQ